MVGKKYSANSPIMAIIMNICHPKLSTISLRTSLMPTRTSGLKSTITDSRYPPRDHRHDKPRVLLL